MCLRVIDEKQKLKFGHDDINKNDKKKDCIELILLVCRK